MMIGRMARAMLGPLEIPVTKWYRGVFFDSESLARVIRSWISAEEILEVGCGEGQLTQCLARQFPEASITGIDITPRVGRLFRGDSRRVIFLQETIQEFAAAHPACFDLVVICDVMHHLAWEMHSEFLNVSRSTLRPGGGFVLKDWEKTKSPICLLGYLSDRYITGDRIRYGTADDFRKLIHEVLGTESIQREERFRPWSNNLAFFCRVPGDWEIVGEDRARRR